MESEIIILSYIVAETSSLYYTGYLKNGILDSGIRCASVKLTELMFHGKCSKVKMSLLMDKSYFDTLKNSLTHWHIFTINWQFQVFPLQVYIFKLGSQGYKSSSCVARPDPSSSEICFSLLHTELFTLTKVTAGRERNATFHDSFLMINHFRNPAALHKSFEWEELDVFLNSCNWKGLIYKNDSVLWL